MRYGISAIVDGVRSVGAHAGTRVAKIILTDCNLWDGKPLHRTVTGNGPCAMWCDCVFIGGSVMDEVEIVETIEKLGCNTAEISGGEPAISITSALMDRLADAGIATIVDTNGSVENEALLLATWICVSPKVGVPLMLEQADEAIVTLPGAVYPARGWDDDDLERLEAGNYGKLYVCPQDPLLDISSPNETHLTAGGSEVYGPEADDIARKMYDAHVIRCMMWIAKHGNWQLTLQLNKLAGVP